VNKGDIVLVPFPFTDLSGNKNRSVVVLFESEDDVTVCFITTQLKFQSEYDIFLQPTKLDGLKQNSLIKLHKLATLDNELVIGRLGMLDVQYMTLLNKNLISLLRLESK